jgi:hypothetical protein
MRCAARRSRADRVKFILKIFGDRGSFVPQIRQWRRGCAKTENGK